MKTYKETLEEGLLGAIAGAGKSIHPMAVHVMKGLVQAVGVNVQHVKVGDKVSSSDMDDLTDAGHKVKEL